VPYKVLEGVRVLEVARGIAAPWCARLLADYGAEVIKVERPVDREISERQRERDGLPVTDEDAALFLHLNVNKKSVALDLETPSGQRLFRDLASRSAVVVDGLRPGRMAAMEIDYARLRTLRADLVMTSVTPFGQTGPYRDYEYTELTVFAMGGAMYREGVPDRPPLKYGGEIAQYFAGAAAASAAMAACVGALLTGQGDWIDVSIMETMAGHPHQIGRRAPFAYNGEMDERKEPRTSSAGGREPYAVGTFRCKDGFMSFLPLGPRMWPNIARMIGRPELTEDPRFIDTQDRTDNRIELEAIFQAWLDQRTRSQVFQAAHEAGIPAGPVLTQPEVIDDEHFKSREYFQEIEHPDYGPLTHPGLPFKLSDAPTSSPRPAPGLGQHTAEVLSTVLGMDDTYIKELRDAGVVS
jgi:crotonobetainyl-CoA:carnitine CoA-transferase CaiB-like acyl-CoA transferase